MHLEFKVKVWEEIGGILEPFEVECLSTVRGQEARMREETTSGWGGGLYGFWDSPSW